MNWLTNFVRPKLRALVSRKEAPENLWLKCPKCEQMLFMRDWEANQEVCNHCGHHMRIRPLKRLPHLFDEGKYELHPLPRVTADPLKFRDTKRYDARLKDGHRGG
jgi:acetyl-CoA carboxylase carboxyl transferase subunit beta